MIKRKLHEIVEMVLGQGLNELDQNIVINGVSIDTRTVKAGNLFIPIIGENFNGHEFVETAVENGAVASFWQENQPNPPGEIPLIYVKDTLKALQSLAVSYRNELSIKVVGITGSNGKTTTKDMVAAVLSMGYKVQKTEGNLNNHLGLPLTILRLAEDTEIAVLEMGMSGRGEIELLSTIARPDAAIITNIGESHLLDLGSREGIAEAKLEITAGLDQHGVLIYYGDEPLLAERVQSPKMKTTTFGSTSVCDYSPRMIRQESAGTYFSVNEQQIEYFIPVLGKHNVNNALAAVAIATHFGVSTENISKGLANLKITTMRTELVEGKNGVHIINDAYNASPTSMKAAIELLQDLKGYSKKIVVLGDMLELGKDERNFHYEIGSFIHPEKIDYVFAFGELAKHIAKGAIENFQTDNVLSYTEKSALIEKLESILAENDIVLVKGSRAMKLEEVVTALL